MLNVFLTNMQLLASQDDVNWWTGVVWIVKFLSAVWALILTAPIHCRASIAETLMQWYISTNLLPWRNKFLANFHFWMNSFFNLELWYMQLCIFFQFCKDWEKSNLESFALFKPLQFFHSDLPCQSVQCGHSMSPLLVNLPPQSSVCI